MPNKHLNRMQERKLTVVIPCRNERAFIRECVEAIYACELPAGTAMRVFVVDGLSDDGTIEEIQQLQQEFAGLELVENTRQLTPYAFNLGIYAGGKVDYVQIVGARHILSPNYLLRSIELLEQHPETWCVGGRLENVFLNDTGRIISLAMDTALGMGIGNFRILDASGYTDTVTSPMYPYRVFETIGFFDEMLIRNQDDDFNFRVTKAGGKIWFEHEISLRYYVRGNFKGLFRQFYQYGYWKVFVNRKHKTVTTIRQLAPPAFVFFLLVSPFSFLFPAFIWLPVSAVLALYVLLIGLFGLKKGQTLKEKLQVAMTFPILHVSYGWGYLKGIVHFLVLRKQPSEQAKQLSR